MAGEQGAEAVSGEEAGAGGGFGEEGVAFAFERGGAGEVDDGVAGGLEPVAEVGLFGLTLGVEEAGEDDDSVAFEAGVGGEDHVGRAGLRFDEDDFGDLAEGMVELMPLGGGALAGDGVDVVGHPGVDDVVDVIELRRAHEEGGAGGWVRSVGAGRVRDEFHGLCADTGAVILGRLRLTSEVLDVGTQIPGWIARGYRGGPVPVRWLRRGL